MTKIRKLFRETDLNWGRIILLAVIVGIYAGIMAALPVAKDTSFADISISFEWWVLFGIFIILNSKSPLDSGLKCIAFFLISQPLVYLTQVLVFHADWSIFGYYQRWFLWTLLTFPMGFIGNYLKKNRWWGLLILTPMLALVGLHYANFLGSTITWFPHHLLSTFFCAVTILLYPIVSFDDIKLKRAGLVIAALILIVATAVNVTGGSKVYSTDILASSESGDGYFDDTYTATLKDDAYGEVSIAYVDALETYLVHADFKKQGTTELILTSPAGEETVYQLTIGKDTYQLDRVE